MAIPDFQTIMLPLLKIHEDKEEHSLRQTIDELAIQFNLTQEEQNQLLPSGQEIFHNKVGWSRTHLKKAGLIEYTQRGYSRILDRGLKVLTQKPERIGVKFLKQFREYKEFLAMKSEKPQDEETETATPEETLANAYQSLRDELANGLLEQLKKGSSRQFERIVIKLLVAMGYGGFRPESATVTGKSGDEGIDGVINQDKLGLDTIYVQAKRWDGSVGSPEIHKFVGALDGKGSEKGILITTASFSSPASDAAARSRKKLILIDGKALVQYMIDHNIGVSQSGTYEIKKIDLDFFAE